MRLTDSQIKELEAVYDQTMNVDNFIIVRLDGKSFHTWVKGLTKPFCKGLQDCFDITTQQLMRETGAVLGYTQSDEISLLFSPYVGSFPFSGRVNKINSTFASMATYWFNTSVANYLEAGSRPPAFFDCRCFDVDTQEIALECIRWREIDAMRNSVQALAQSLYPHNKLLNKRSAALLSMSKEKGVNWFDLPARSRFGVYYLRTVERRKLDIAELTTLPEKHHARSNPDFMFDRVVITKAPFDQLVSCQDFSFIGGPHA